MPRLLQWKTWPCCVSRQNKLIAFLIDNSILFFSPLDILTFPQHRLVYAFIFGLMSNSFLTLAFGGVVADICDSMSGVDWAICRTS